MAHFTWPFAHGNISSQSTASATWRVQGCTPKTANNLSATGYHPMPSEYDEKLDSTDTQLPGEYDLFDLMAQVTEENLHAPVDSGPPVGREAL